VARNEKKSRVLVLLLLGVAFLQGCSNVDQISSDEIQSADKAPVAVATLSPVKQPVSATSAFSRERTTTAPDNPLPIAEKRDIYGDARLWPLLQRNNSQQVGSQEKLSVGQVLRINRNVSVEEKSILIKGIRPLKPVTVLAATQVTPTASLIEVPVVATEAVLALALMVSVTPIAPAVEIKGTTALAGSTKQTVKTAKYLSAARRAFSAGDLAWSSHYYGVHLKIQNRDANAWGELGNVHFTAGNLTDSAQAYFAAANILIDQGQSARAIKLLPTIQAGNVSLAESLHLRLTTTKR
jgi:hypothetical protein